MKVNNYPVKSPSTGDRLFGSDSNGDQKQFDMSAVSSNVFQHDIGEYVVDEGGVIFHRYLDGDTQKYLVVGLSDLSYSQVWSNVEDTLIGSTAQSTWDGLSNSNAIVGESGFINGAAKLCLDSTANNQTDWYLPALDELSLLWQNRFNVNRTLSGASSYGIITSAVNIEFDGYWSSTEWLTNKAWYIDFEGGNPIIAFKENTYTIRAVRKFSI